MGKKNDNIIFEQLRPTVDRHLLKVHIGVKRLDQALPKWRGLPKPCLWIFSAKTPLKAGVMSYTIEMTTKLIVSSIKKGRRRKEGRDGGGAFTISSSSFYIKIDVYKRKYYIHHRYLCIQIIIKVLRLIKYFLSNKNLTSPILKLDAN